MSKKEKLTDLMTGLSFTTPRFTPEEVVKAFLDAGESVNTAGGAIKGLSAAMGAEEVVISETSPDGTQARVKFVNRRKSSGKVGSTMFSVLLTVEPAGVAGCIGVSKVESVLTVKRKAVKAAELEQFKDRFATAIGFGRA